MSRNQTCQDQGPLTLERSKTVDEEISAKVIDFLDRNDPKHLEFDHTGHQALAFGVAVSVLRRR